MSKIEKNAVIFAKEMVEHNLMHGASHLDTEYIATQACELAYKIHEKSKAYKPHKEPTVSEVTTVVAPTHHPY